jgi:dCTP deaminase
VLAPQMKIAQISFMLLDYPANMPYGHKDLGSKYQHQEGPEPSKYDLNSQILD